ncbi:hypothetical protein ACP70R_045521 [Stipagrostis hirtigluma subsp. patula]
MSAMGLLAGGLLKVAAGKVAAAAGDRIMLQWRFHEDLEEMRDTMEAVNTVLGDAERRAIQDGSTELWLKRLARASQDISDLFDEFEVNTTRKSPLRKFKVLNPCLTLGSEFRMAGNMKKLKEKLEKISNDRDKYNLSGSSSSTEQQVISNLEAWPSGVNADILGRDQEKQEVIDLLMEASNSSEFIVLPIYGIGGIGKTTLANLLYNDTQFKAYKKAWVFVSQTFDLKKIRHCIISELQKEQNQLTETVGPDAASKKILIVLDDVWEKDGLKLDALKRFLKDAGNGCKMHVIVTTRDADIAQKMKTNEAKKINQLSSDMCWAIIKQIVGFEERADKEILEVTGKEIAGKCGGVALAARALGHMLKYRDFNGWVSVKDSCLWNLSMPGHTPSEYDHVYASLNLSFRSMNAYLRLCFAYCAIFPKGHKMAKDDLIYQWAALGFMEPSSEVSAWEHGESYINQLVGMSFFEHSKSSSSAGSYGEDITLFTMHDLVHDLSLLIMGDEVIDASSKCNTGTRNCRYASLADCSKPLNSFLPHPDKIRALRLLENWKIGQCAAEFSIAKYLRLRVMDFAECSIEKLPTSIGKLKQLRYLNAPGIQDRMILSCITKLSKLIYLNLRGSSAISALPKSIGEMEDLMYLNLSGCSKIRELPKSFGKLKNLVHVDFSKCTHVTGVSKVLENLTQLQYLNLSFCRNIGEVPLALGRLTKLQYLNLSHSSYFEGWSDYDVFSTLTKLRYLNLSCCFGVYRTSPVLQRLLGMIGKLTELRYLNLSSCVDHICKQEKEDGEASDRIIGSFLDSISTLSHLEHLDLSHTWGLLTIPDSFCSLRKLHTLDLMYCRKLQRLPENITDMDSLKFLIVKGCVALDMSSLGINKSLIQLPHFRVHAAEGEQSSNLVLLKDATPPELEISGLENVKSVQETQIIELRKKQSIVRLALDWTGGKKGHVEDMDLLTGLTPPSSLKEFELRGYSSVRFPEWLMDIATYLPNLSGLQLTGLSQCSSLPPLGQLPNLKYLSLEAMPRVTKIDKDFCGGEKAFPQLEELSILNMEKLETWIAAYSSGVVDEFMFPNLRHLTIDGCHKLRVSPRPPRVQGTWIIKDSDDVLLQWGENVPHSNSSTSRALVDSLEVESSMAPMHQWKLLHHLPCLKSLNIKDCNYLSCPSKIPRELCSFRELVLDSCCGMTSLPEWVGDLTSLSKLFIENCSGIQVLPERLGDLASLQLLKITECPGIASLPESIRRLTNLRHLWIVDCPALRSWCESEENMTKIGHIIEICIDGQYIRLENKWVLNKSTELDAAASSSERQAAHETGK